MANPRLYGADGLEDADRDALVTVIERVLDAMARDAAAGQTAFAIVFPGDGGMACALVPSSQFSPQQIAGGIAARADVFTRDGRKRSRVVIAPAARSMVMPGWLRG